jgi:hypothetical protein
MSSLLSSEGGRFARSKARSRREIKGVGPSSSLSIESLVSARSILNEGTPSPRLFSEDEEGKGIG